MVDENGEERTNGRESKWPAMTKPDVAPAERGHGREQGRKEGRKCRVWERVSMCLSDNHHSDDDFIVRIKRQSVIRGRN